MRAIAVFVRREGLRNTIRAGLGVLRDFGWRGVWRRRRRAADAAARDAEYAEWLARHSPTPDDYRRLSLDIQGWTAPPLVSIVVPVHDTEPPWLEACVASVRAQLYPHWELLLCDDASTRPETIAALRGYEADPRIRVTYLREPRHIAGASNAALALARGEFVALLDHDDELTPDALAEVVRAIRAAPDLDVVYSDEDKLRANGRRTDPFFKPDWSPTYLRSCMYLGHLLVIRRRLVEDVGGFRDAYSGAQDYDLALRATGRTTRIAHIPRVLYHWRVAAGSSAHVGAAKPWADEAARAALEDDARRRGSDAAIERGEGYGLYVWKPRPGPQQLVRVIVTADPAHRDGAAAIARLQASTAYRAAEWIGAGPPEGTPAPPHPHWATAVNAALSASAAPIVAVIDAGLAPETPDWLDRLVAHLSRESVGMVTPRLDQADGRIHALGLALGVGPGWARVLEGADGEALGYFGNAVVPHECAAASASCLVVNRRVLDRAGGFDERCGADAAAVALALSMRDAGDDVVCAADVRLRWRSAEVTPPAAGTADLARLRAAWPDAFARDPYFNPNFDRNRADFRLIPRDRPADRVVSDRSAE